MKDIIKGITIFPDRKMKARFLEETNIRMNYILNSDNKEYVKAQKIRDLLYEMEHKIRMQAIEVRMQIDQTNCEDIYDLSKLQRIPVIIYGIEYLSPSMASFERDEYIVDILKQLADPTNNDYQYKDYQQRMTLHRHCDFSYVTRDERNEKRRYDSGTRIPEKELNTGKAIKWENEPLRVYGIMYENLYHASQETGITKELLVHMARVKNENVTFQNPEFTRNIINRHKKDMEFQFDDE